MSSLDTASTAVVTPGPVHFGDVSSGDGTVVFGTSSPGVTAAVSNLTANPWMLLAAGGVLLVGLYLYLRTRRK